MNTMLGHWRIGHVMLLLCALSLWAEMAMCGSSFLSPSQRPQNRGDRKPPRVGRRAASDLDPPLNPQEITVSAPFELVLSLTRTEYEDYGAALQKMLLNVLGICLLGLFQMGKTDSTYTERNLNHNNSKNINKLIEIV